MIGDRRRFRFSCVKASWAAIVRGAGHVALAAIRATTHVDGKPRLSSYRCHEEGRRVGFCIPRERRSDAGVGRAPPDAWFSS